MIHFIKKYRFTIIPLLILSGLLLLFIPHEESRYLQSEWNAIKEKAHTVLLWTLGIGLGVLFLLGIRQLKKVTDTFYLLAGLAAITLSCYFFFQPVFFSSALLLNQLSKKEKVTQTYRVVAIDSKGPLLLWDDALQTSIQANRLVQKPNAQNIKPSDTLVVTFKKGLLGYLLDPAIE